MTSLASPRPARLSRTPGAEALAEQFWIGFAYSSAISESRRQSLFAHRHLHCPRTPHNSKNADSFRDISARIQFADVGLHMRAECTRSRISTARLPSPAMLPDAGQNLTGDCEYTRRRHFVLCAQDFRSFQFPDSWISICGPGDFTSPFEPPSAKESQVLRQLNHTDYRLGVRACRQAATRCSSSCALAGNCELLEFARRGRAMRAGDGASILGALTRIFRASAAGMSSARQGASSSLQLRAARKTP